MTQPWMSQAWAMVGQSEAGGPAANPAIIQMFADAGHPDITSDETAWCAADVSACLFRAGLPYPKGYASLRAASFETWGTACELRVGAIVVVRARGDGRHVGFVAGFDDRNVMVLGGNQADAHNVTPFQRASVVAVRWPAPPVTPTELAAAGSRTVNTAGDVQKDAIKATGAEVSAKIAEQHISEIDAWAAKAAKAQGMFGQLESFAAFVGTRWPWIAGAFAIYWVSRMAWHAGLIKWLRVEDHNTGANVARVTTGGLADGVSGESG